MPVIRDLKKLTPAVEKACRKMLKIAHGEGLYIIITETLRTKQRQRELYAQGRTKPGKVVTWTLHSRHLVGDAFDIAFDPKHHGSLYPRDQRLWERAGQIGESLGLERGGRWKKFVDRPHFQGGGRVSPLPPASSTSSSPKTPEPHASRANHEQEDGTIWQKLVEQFVEKFERGEISQDVLEDTFDDIQGDISAYIKQTDLKEVAIDYLKNLDRNEVLEEMVYIVKMLVKRR